MASVVVEHVLLLNTREGVEEQDPKLVNDMVNGLNSLNSMDEVLYLTAGPIFRSRWSSSPLKFTHMLHARYRSLSDLAAHAAHPRHVGVVEELIKPICDDMMAVDWVRMVEAKAGTGAVPHPHPGSAIRLTLFNINNNTDEDDDMMVTTTVLDGLAKIKENSKDFPYPFEQMSYGIINHHPGEEEERSKGYKIAALAVFPDLNELDACEEYQDQMRSLIIDNYKVKPSLLAFISLDYVLPRHTHLTHN